MRILPAISLVGALLLFAACTTTTISANKALDGDAADKLEISQVSVEALPESQASSTILAALKKAVEDQVAARNIAGDPARLEMTVSHVKILAQDERLLLGALAGANELNVTASVISQSDDTLLAEFEILGAHNPAALGAFSDQEVSTAESVAESLLEEIYGK